jgi:hypothetical protein
MKNARRKMPPWLASMLVGSFTYGFTSEPEFLHLPEEKRRTAARVAQQRALGTWPVWVSILALLLGLLVVALVDRAFYLGSGFSEIAAMLVFISGLALIQRSVYYAGLPYYRAALRIAVR